MYRDFLNLAKNKIVEFMNVFIKHALDKKIIVFMTSAEVRS